VRLLPIIEVGFWSSPCCRCRCHFAFRRAIRITWVAHFGRSTPRFSTPVAGALRLHDQDQAAGVGARSSCASWTVLLRAQVQDSLGPGGVKRGFTAQREAPAIDFFASTRASLRFTPMISKTGGHTSAFADRPAESAVHESCGRDGEPLPGPTYDLRWPFVSNRVELGGACCKFLITFPGSRRGAVDFARIAKGHCAEQGTQVLIFIACPSNLRFPHH